MCNENRIGVVSKLDQAPILSWKYWSKAFWNPKKLVYQMKTTQWYNLEKTNGFEKQRT
jgi:hypothetical protein